MFSTEAQQSETIEKLLTTQILHLPQAAATALAPKILDLCDNGLTVLGLQAQIKVLVAANAPSARQDQADEIAAALTETGLYPAKNAPKLEAIERILIPLLQVPMSATTTTMAVKVLDLCDNGLTTLEFQRQLQTLVAQLAPSAQQGQADEITAALLQAGLYIPPAPSSTPAPPDLSLIT